MPVKKKNNKGNNMFNYRTVSGRSRVKIAVGACRFICSLSPSETEEEAHAFINLVKEELPGATHHAYAYRLGMGEKLLARFSDDGEPALTAGPPMLSVLEKEALTNVVLVGTRYFGGVKLGIGGLVRAYRSCAQAGVKEALICEKELQTDFIILIPYDYLGGVLKEIEAREGKVLDFTYRQDVQIRGRVPLREKDTLISRLTEISRGAAIIYTNDINENSGEFAGG